MLNDRKNIVVIDDEKEITSLYTDILESRFQIIEFNKPEEFLKFLQFHNHPPFHAVITDFKMPKMTGMQMIQKAFAMGYKFPFIMLSGHLDKETVIKAVEYGAFRLIEKPVSAQALFETIDQIVIEHEMHITREQIRVIINQLRESYSHLRGVLTNFMPENDLNQMVIETNSDGQVIKAGSFEKLMDQLEGRLDDLLETEKTLEYLKKVNSKKAA